MPVHAQNPPIGRDAHVQGGVRDAGGGVRDACCRALDVEVAERDGEVGGSRRVHRFDLDRLGRGHFDVSRNRHSARTHRLLGGRMKRVLVGVATVIAERQRLCLCRNSATRKCEQKLPGGDASSTKQYDYVVVCAVVSSDSVCASKSGESGDGSGGYATAIAMSWRKQ